MPESEGRTATTPMPTAIAIKPQATVNALEPVFWAIALPKGAPAIWAI